jgi:hypothetical protein
MLAANMLFCSCPAIALQESSFCLCGSTWTFELQQIKTKIIGITIVSRLQSYNCIFNLINQILCTTQPAVFCKRWRYTNMHPCSTVPFHLLAATAGNV